MSDLKVGQTIDASAQRDAIHVAVAPVTAAHILAPGEHIGFVSDEDRETVGRVSEKIGIVDPFMAGPVFPGQRFWMFLYPQTITSLRHDWTHPAFVRFEEGKTAQGSMGESEAWLRRFCETADCPGYETVMRIVAEGSFLDDDNNGGRMDGDSLVIIGSSAYGDIPDEFWTHAEIVLGRTIPNKPKWFSCSC